MLSSLLSILILEDNPADADLLQEILIETDRDRWELVHVERLSAALECLRTHNFDVVLSDLSLPDTQGLDAVTQIHAAVPDLPIVVLTGFNDENVALEAVRQGAQDYLVKGQINYNLLVRTLRYAMERTRTQKLLHQSERRFRAIFDQTFQFIWLLKPDGTLLEANQTALEYGGLTQVDIIGCSFWEARWWNFSPSGQASLRAALAEAASGRFIRYEAGVRGVGNTVAMLDFSLKPVINDSGQVMLLIAEGRDISDRKRAEAALEESYSRLQAVIENTTDMIFVKNVQGCYQMINSAGTLILGKSVEKVIGKNDLELFQPDVAQALMEIDRQVLATNEPIISEEAIPVGDSTRTYLSMRNLYRDPQGNVLGLIGIARDITERKQAEIEIHKALATEKELNQLKSNFISMASHEFRTPLSAIALAARLLEQFGQQATEEQKRTYFNRIQSSVKRMTQLLDDVLLLGKAEFGKLHYQPSPLNLEQLCCELVEELQLTDGNQYRLTFTSVGECINACMDENLLRHILNNLLSNAIKYSPPGGSVNFTLACQDRLAIFQIADEGIGIPIEDRQHLFESFHRCNNVGKIPGTGLGLAIVKKCVDIHGGEIAVTSTVGAGTTFTVTLPLHHEM